MLQLSVIVVLVLSTFVGRASPVLQKEDHEKIKVEVATNLNNTANIVSDSTSKVISPSIKAAQDKNENLTKISTSPKNPSNVDMTTPLSVQKLAKNEKKNCNSTKEQEDMLHCQVTPRDDDDIIEQNVSLNSTEPTVNATAAASDKTETNATSQGTNVPPVKDVDSGKKNGGTVVNSTEVTDHVSYEVVTAETDHPTNISKTDVSSTNSKRDNNTGKAAINSGPPLLGIDKISDSTGSENIVSAVKSADQVNNKRMPSGIIALVTAISFAVAIALVYVGMIVWRRYIEYRYGHRELLVNELEFDTNDLRHFEL